MLDPFKSERVDVWIQIIADNHRLHFLSFAGLVALLQYIHDCYENPVLHGDC